jgi:hypothetical protein
MKNLIVLVAFTLVSFTVFAANEKYAYEGCGHDTLRVKIDALFSNSSENFNEVGEEIVKVNTCLTNLLIEDLNNPTLKNTDKAIIKAQIDSNSDALGLLVELSALAPLAMIKIK